MALAGPNVCTAHHIPLALFSAPLERRIIHHYPSIESILDQHVAACALLIATIEWIVEWKGRPRRTDHGCRSSRTIFKIRKQTKARNRNGHQDSIARVLLPTTVLPGIRSAIFVKQADHTSGQNLQLVL